MSDVLTLEALQKQRDGLLKELQIAQINQQRLTGAIGILDKLIAASKPDAGKETGDGGPKVVEEAA